MTCEDYLNRYRDALIELEELDGSIRLAEGRLQRITANYDGVKVQGSHDRRDAEAELADLSRERQEKQDAANLLRDEISSFISKVSVGTGDAGRRYRRLLKLYYCDGLAWGDIAKAMRPLRTRKDGRQVTCKSGSGISETTLFRVRLEALAAADLEFRRLGIG